MEIRDDSTRLDGDAGQKTIQQRELADHAREMSGTSPRITRFVNEETDPRLQEKKRLERQIQQALNELQQRLRDPEYLAAWEAANNAIDRAQTALDIALEENSDLIEDLEDRAPKLANGRAVFVNPDGTGRTKDGEVISITDMAMLTLPLNAPTWDEYEAARQRRVELAGYGDDIERVRTETNDPDNPPSKPRLEDITKDMDVLTRKVEGRPILTKAFNPASFKQDTSMKLDFESAPVQQR